MSAARPVRALAVRFWEKVEKTDGCWLWRASFATHGYGQFRVMRNGRYIMEKAHRTAWQLANGKIPSGMCVLHRCDTPACVRPDHLWLGTQVENIKDMHAKGRVSRGRRHSIACQRGEEHWSKRMPEKWMAREMRGSKNPAAKRTEAEIAEMKRMRQAGATVAEVANRFGVDRKQMWAILAGKVWGHVCV